LQRIEPGLPRPLQRKTLPALTADDSKLAEPSMATLVIEGGRRDKLRAGDVLGALTAGGAIAGDQVGKIQVQETRTYVAVKRGLEQHALDALANGRIKKRRFRVSKVAAG
jgi:ATP-independent RNA helicase DbpA